MQGRYHEGTARTEQPLYYKRYAEQLETNYCVTSVYKLVFFVLSCFLFPSATFPLHPLPYFTLSGLTLHSMTDVTKPCMTVAERLRLYRERQEQIQRRGIETLKEMDARAEEYRRKQEEDRRRSMRMARTKEEEQRASVEERRRKILEDEHVSHSLSAYYTQRITYLFIPLSFMSCRA